MSAPLSRGQGSSVGWCCWYVIWPQLFDTVKWPLGEPHTGLAGPERLAAAVVPAETAGAVPDRRVPIEVATAEHPQAGTRTTPGLLATSDGGRGSNQGRI
jgi:hypothetical protein